MFNAIVFAFKRPQLTAGKSAIRARHSKGGPYGHSASLFGFCQLSVPDISRNRDVHFCLATNRAALETIGSALFVDRLHVLREQLRAIARKHDFLVAHCALPAVSATSPH